MGGIPEGKDIVMCVLCYHREVVSHDTAMLDNTSPIRCPRCDKAFMRYFNTHTTPGRIKRARIELEKSIKKLDRSIAGQKGADTRRANATMHKLFGTRLADGFRMMSDDE